MRPFLHFSVLFLFLSTGFLHAQQKEGLLIAAASDLQFALDSVVKAYPGKANGSVEVVYASSGKLFEQISYGAPFHLYFSADIAYPTRLHENRLTASAVYAYGVGKIVVWSKTIDLGSKKMGVFLLPSVKKVAVANPRHAPYGRGGVEALVYFKLLESLKDKLVYGENISQTAQFVTSGAADIGVIALSLALSSNMQKQDGSYFIIPEESYHPLVQGAVITHKGKDHPVAFDFFEFIKSEQANAIFAHFGFEKPTGR